MKETGVTWMPKIGDGFILYKLKHLLAKPLLYGASESGIPYDNNLPRYIRITDISLDGRLKDNEKLSLSYESANGYILNDKDILLARSGATVGKAFLYKKEYGSCAFAGYLIKASLNPKLIIPEFLFYYTQCSTYEEWKNQIFVQATIQNIGADKYSELHIPVPSLIKQQDIITFLDRKCADIDNVLGKTKASIEEYKKLKQSVITEVVTKGIHSGRPMRNSGIEWIGGIPQDWKIRPLKACLFERQEKNIPIVSRERLSLSIDLGVTLYSEKTTNLDRFKDDFTQYKIAHIGDLVLNSMNMIVGAVGISDYFGCVSPAYYTFYDKEDDNIVTRYFNYLFHTKTIMRVLFSLGKGIYAIERGDDKVNTCRLKVSREDLRAMKFPYPPEDEQREIVSYLDKKCSDIDSLIASKEKIITELESYKKSLINECITGKMEVPTTV